MARARVGLLGESRRPPLLPHRLGQPEDIANVIVFLAGPDSGWGTGQNIRVSGGGLLV